jgi:multiple sugar transport system ATP-binding protein
MAVVTLDRLSKNFAKGRPAVDQVSLTVADGEFMVLLGPSGCGKTTTLRMVAGLETISAGRLSIDGRTMNGVQAKDRDIAMVFQSYALYPHMNVRDNLAFGLRRRGVDRAEIDQRVRDVATALRLSDYLDRRPHALSGGQRQRVALGRAIVRDPKVFLFDEPLSNLDAGLRASTRGEIARLHRRLAATMIYVTHDQVEAMTLGDRICVMQDGRVAQVGPPLDVYQRPANIFVARFLGSPPMNVIPGRARLSDGVIEAALEEQYRAVPAFDTGSAAAALVQDEGVLVGIRPESLRPVEQGAGWATGLVQAVERLGAETIILTTLAGGTELAVRVATDLRVEPGERIGLEPAPGELHLFDPRTGEAFPRLPAT